MMNRQEAEIQLQKLFSFKQFYDLQWQVIENLLAGKRVLFIEKTGFGKSLCFQFPATQLKGVTIVFFSAYCLNERPGEEYAREWHSCCSY